SQRSADQIPPRVRRSLARLCRSFVQAMGSWPGAGTKGQGANLADTATAACQLLMAIYGGAPMAFPEDVQIQIFEALNRHYRRPGFAPLLAIACSSGGFREAERCDQVALLRQLSGPDIGSEGSPVHLDAIEEIWDRRRARFQRILTSERYRSLEPSQQAQAL